MALAAVFAIAVGILMIVQWGVTIARGQVALKPGEAGGRGKVEMAFHVAAELSTAFLLIISGIALLVLGKERGLSVFLVALGMLIYTVVNSPGYFAQQGKWGMVGMFGALLVGALIILLLVT